MIPSEISFSGQIQYPRRIFEILQKLPVKDYSQKHHNVHKRWGFLKKWGFFDDSTGFHIRKPYLGKSV